MSERVFNVLFLCTGNTARSILAEAILNKDGRGRFRAYSAGSQPKGVVNPVALSLLQRLDYPTEGLRSKSWQEFAKPGAPVDGFRVHGLRQRRRRGLPGLARPADDRTLGHRGPGRVEGSDAEKEAAFIEAHRLLKNRIAAFISLPLKSIDALALGPKLREIGGMDGATAARDRASCRAQDFDLPRRLAAEALGTALLVATVVGSGIMAETLTKDVALALLCNTLPTGAILVVLITLLGPVSGAHFNPAVSVVFALKRELLRAKRSSTLPPRSRVASSGQSSPT